MVAGRTVPVVRGNDGTIVAERVELAWDFVGRLRGLMGRSSIEPGDGVWLRPCSSIHMMFVRFPIDVVFLDQGDRVLKVAPSVRPWIGVAGCLGAESALELAAGEAERRGVRIGDKLVNVEGPGCPAR